MSKSEADLPTPLDTTQRFLDVAIAQFSELGITHLEVVFATDEWEDLKEFAESRFAEIRDISRSHERQIRLVRLHAMFPEMLRWLFPDPLKLFCEAMWGQDPLCIQSQLFLKPPMANGMGFHQDTFYIKARPWTPLALWIPLEDADEENGCLVFAPRSRALGPIEHKKHEPAGDTAVANPQRFTDIHMRLPEGMVTASVCVREGGCLLFDGDLIHGSLPNISNSRTRKSMVLHFVPAGTTHISKFHWPPIDSRGRSIAMDILE